MMSTARERVQAFVDSHESWEGEDSHISTTGEYGSPVRLSLYSNDLRALLAELAHWESLAHGEHPTLEIVRRD
jgi:hypothetical protein